MSDVWATAISGIGAAIIAGIISIISSFLAYRAASKQLELQIQENEKNRQHEFHTALLSKRQQSIEDVWKLIFEVERSNELNEIQMDIFIRSVMWLPQDLRNACLSYLSRKDKVNLAELRQKLIDASKVSQLD